MPDYRQHKVETLMALLGQGMQSGMQAGSAGALQQMKGQQEQEQEKLKDYLQGQAQAKSIERAKEIYGGAPEGVGVSVSKDGAAFTRAPNPNAQDNKNKAGDAAARAKANSIYNSGLPKIQAVAQAAAEGLDFSNDPKNIGSLGQARTLMLKAMGMNRYNADEAAAVLPQSLQGTVAGLFNAAGSDTAPLNESQRASVNSFFRGQLGAAGQQHSTLKQNAMNAYNTSPYMSPEGTQVMQAVGSPFEQQLNSYQTKYKEVPKTPGPNLTPAPNPGLIDKISSWLNPDKTAAPAAAPVDPRARLEELRKKAAGQPLGQ